MVPRDVPEHPLRPAAEADLARLVPLLEQLVGRRSAWAGGVAVRELTFPQAGRKERQCVISLREDTLRHAPARWQTMLHEAVHSVSAGYTPGRKLSVTEFRWEEAIVEQAARLLRPRALRAAGVELDEDVFREFDRDYLYNGFIRALEMVRTSDGREPEPFYLGLLGATHEERAGILVAAARALRVQQQKEPP